MNGLRQGATDVDLQLGARLRELRTLHGVSQERLAGAVGLTFQQVQKYERGSNRISVSRLLQFARFLDIPVASFYEELGDQVVATRADDPLQRRETLELVRAYYRLSDRTRRRAFELIKAIGADETIPVPTEARVLEDA